MPEPLRLKGITASSGYAEGPLFPLHREESAYLARGSRRAEADALRTALAHATARIGALIATASGESAAILEFQLAMLDDKTLTEPAFAAIAEGTTANDAWVDAIDAEIVGY
jgi:phosphoenolpyruvate-protein phosphotransferase (PTS system enzyme I)